MASVTRTATAARITSGRPTLPNAERSGSDSVVDDGSSSTASVASLCLFGFGFGWASGDWVKHRWSLTKAKTMKLLPGSSIIQIYPG